MWIGVGGSIGSGKSILYSEYFKDLRYEEIELAGTMKKFLAEYYNKDINIFYDREIKEFNNFEFVIDGNLLNAISFEIYNNSFYLQSIKPVQEVIIKTSPRELLQYVGTEFLRNRKDDIHFDWVLKGKTKTGNENYYFQALRFPNEIEFVEKGNGVTLYIERGKDLTVNGKEHASENSVSGSDFNYVVSNDGTKEELFKRVEQIIKEN